jgi:hypothetical protein
VKRLQEERARLEDRVIPELLAQWEDVELALADVT